MIETCKCGWRVEVLQRELAKWEGILRQEEEGMHPFKVAGIEGHKIKIENIARHLAEPRKAHYLDS